MEMFFKIQILDFSFLQRSILMKTETSTTTSSFITIAEAEAEIVGTEMAHAPDIPITAITDKGSNV